MIDTYKIIQKNGVTKKWCLLFILFIFCISIFQPITSAISSEQKKLYNQNILYYDLEAGCTNVEAVADDTVSGSSNAEIVYNFFVGKGYKPFQAAAIIGNMTVESGVQPQRLQGTPINTITPAEEWRDINGGGWGLVQWTPGSKMINPVREAGKDPNDILVQLDFLYTQLEGTGALSEKAAGDQFKATTNIKDAVLAFQGNRSAGGQYIGFERPQDQRGSVPKRLGAAKGALRKFEGTSVAIDTTASSTTATSDNCACPSSSGQATGKTVVLDPGHSGSTITETDPTSGITAQDSNNGKETTDMWEVSQKISTKLQATGYNVINTKKSADDTVGLLARARIANDAKADIAVSLHSTPGNFGNATAGWVTPQEVGLFRKTGSRTKTFEDQAIADLSSQYSNKILDARKQQEGGVQIHGLDFSGRRLPATGNISIVQLFSTVPWIYNEVGQTGIDLNKYADGIATGIINSLGSSSPGTPTPATSTSGCIPSSGGAVTGDLASTVLAYAWPDYHAPQYLDRMPAYAEAVTQASRSGIYVGGSVGGVAGIDCGGFVTLLMINSGFEPNYNYAGKTSNGASNTVFGQEPWLRANWQAIDPASTQNLMPGDVAINTDHTYVFVGDVPGFNSKVASASFSTRGNGRAPMAGQETPASTNFNWYRKK